MRLLSYNIHKGVGGSDWRYRLDRIIEVIADEKPDIICLQEVDHNVRRTRYHHQPNILAKELKAETHLYQLNVPKHNGGYGNLILSRWPIRKHHHVSLRMNKRKPRGAQLAVIDSPEGHFQMVNWHLGLREKERRWQANHLLDHHLFNESAHLPTLIAGDFNDWRNSLAWHSFGKHAFVQATTPITRFRSFPAFLSVMALDKVFYRGDVDLRHARTVRTALARKASDHLPLVVDFHLHPPKAAAGAATPNT